MQGRVAYMSRREAGALPLQACLLGAATPAATLASAHSLPTAQGGFDSATPQWLQTLQNQTALGQAALPSMHSMHSLSSMHSMHSMDSMPTPTW